MENDSDCKSYGKVKDGLLVILNGMNAPTYYCESCKKNLNLMTVKEFIN